MATRKRSGYRDKCGASPTSLGTIGNGGAYFPVHLSRGGENIFHKYCMDLSRCPSSAREPILVRGEINDGSRGGGTREGGKAFLRG